MKNKKTILAILSVIAVVLVIIGATYAYWLVTKTQNKENVISSACLDIAITGEKNDIKLTEQYPISDDEGKALTPYEFTVTNKCNQTIDYQVALEAIGTESAAVNADAIKVALDDSVSILSSNKLVDTTVDGAYKSYRLTMGTLTATGSEGASATYKLRLWIDKDASIDEMNKTFTSKVSVTIGQGITNPLKPGTLAYSILENNGGVASEISDFTTELTQKIGYEPEVDIDFSCGATTEDITWYSADVYDSTTKTINISDDKIVGVASTEDCRTGAFNCQGLIYACQDLDGYYCQITDQTVIKENGTCGSASYSYVNSFSKKITSPALKSNGVYATEDELGTSYYFRGDVKNNYVKFGTYSENGPVVGFQSTTNAEKVYDTMEACTGASSYNENCTYLYEENDPMYWRIVRINGDGTIRLIYDGTELVANGLYHVAIIGESAYNTTSDDKKYVGYTYNTSDTDTTQIDSTIKGYVDDWYESHLESNYGKYIADGIFCNDRTIKGQSSTWITFESWNRRVNNQPSLMCSAEDRYSVNKSIGNGLLSKPVGLINSDEAYFAGGTDSTMVYYLNSGEYYWTMSPDSIDPTNNEIYMSKVNNDGTLTNRAANVIYSDGVRPVINLRSDVAFSGLGTINSPYEIVTE